MWSRKPGAWNGTRVDASALIDVATSPQSTNTNGVVMANDATIATNAHTRCSSDRTTALLGAVVSRRANTQVATIISTSDARKYRDAVARPTATPVSTNEPRVGRSSARRHAHTAARVRKRPTLSVRVMRPYWTAKGTTAHTAAAISPTRSPKRRRPITKSIGIAARLNSNAHSRPIT